jgi:putative PIN family toxin of toxin-antitoxin system
VSAGSQPRAVFDCMVFLQASARPTGPAARLFVDFVERGRLELCISDAILEEVRDVLGRPRIRAKNPAITDDFVAKFFSRIKQVASRLEPVPHVFTLPRDPDDEPYLDLAIAVAAGYLVTRDKDLLDLMLDPLFRAHYPGLTILDPAAMLRILDPSAPLP